MIHLSEKSRGVTLRLHCVILIAWLFGLAKSCLLFASKKHERYVVGIVLESLSCYGCNMSGCILLKSIDIAVAVMPAMGSFFIHWSSLLRRKYQLYLKKY